MTEAKLLTIGIDATNIRGGGGLTHLVELLRTARPEVHGVDSIVVWGGEEYFNGVRRSALASQT